MMALGWVGLVQVAAALAPPALAPPALAPPPLVVRVDEERRPVPAMVRADGVRTVSLAALARALDGEVTVPAGAGAPWRLRVDSLWIAILPGDRRVVAGLDTMPLPVAASRAGDTLVVAEALATEVLPALGAGVVYDQGARELLRVAVRPVAAASSPPSRTPSSAEVRRRVVVVDPGHGGRDAGMVGMRVNGRTLLEKQVTLAVARAVRSALQARGVEVVLTRDTDTLVSLADRGGMATRAAGGLFLSLHVNAASPEWTSPGAVRGYETYVLAEARTEAQRRVEALENAVTRFEEGGADGDPLAFIIRDLERNAHLRASVELATLVQDGLRGVHPGPGRGIQQAGFRVLRGASMPAVLVELGYGSHPGDAAFLADPVHQRALAVALAEAAVQFLDRMAVAAQPSTRPTPSPAGPPPAAPLGSPP
ncbi:MAG: N-acetylmuramoyl-L-alanine amidase [Gemmatimonadetes bacterium]|nr:N-acetylmuramoyl-L-alanine amidase [Gemmatimonadota bacterium]